MAAALAVAAVLVVTGAVLATPVPVVRLEGDDGKTVIRLEGPEFRYYYIHSVYRAPTTELLRVEGREIRLVSVFSDDRRVIELLRWPGEPRREAHGYAQDAPDTPGTRMEELRLLTGRGARQRIVAGDREVQLATTFGDGAVRVRPAVASRAALLFERIGK